MAFVVVKHYVYLFTRKNRIDQASQSVTMPRSNVFKRTRIFLSNFMANASLWRAALKFMQTMKRSTQSGVNMPVPYKPTVSVDVKQYFNQRSEYVYNHRDKTVLNSVVSNPCLDVSNRDTTN